MMIMFDKLKKWNWKLFFLILCMGIIAGASNQNFPDIKTGSLFGLGVGCVFGLFMANFTKDE